MKGWAEFLDAVEASLPGFHRQERWWHKVMVPAFETNHETLWKREAQNQLLTSFVGLILRSERLRIKPLHRTAVSPSASCACYSRVVGGERRLRLRK